MVIHEINVFVYFLANLVEMGLYRHFILRYLFVYVEKLKIGAGCNVKELFLMRKYLFNRGGEFKVSALIFQLTVITS